ncbi:hypothetical protein CANCADRAFT_714 [Tortispora caseinolytica NRRL Y-17796]|uniref:Mediator of RNA polymerase II transcription subunit 22 n=1 Tax=Tortispora caseinolytica NRRL Y-17796 TaxID=767744 RepID=A0A1E4TK51_9ASCO|nr:hypothetical protein CANCADRAFT_714 [Tortispora caseinolytica NRRL Y-17796]
MSNTRQVSSLEQRTNEAINQLSTKFVDIIELATSGRKSKATSAAESYQIQCDVESLKRASNELLNVTKSLKEDWIFSKIQPEMHSEQLDDIEKRKELIDAVFAKYISSNLPTELGLFVGETASSSDSESRTKNEEEI